MSSAKALVSACTREETWYWEGGGWPGEGFPFLTLAMWCKWGGHSCDRRSWSHLLWSLLPPELGLPWSPCSVLAGMKCGFGGQVYVFCCPQILALWGVRLQFKRFHLGSRLVLSQSIRQSWLGVSTVVLTVLSLQSETLQAHLWDKGKIWIWELYQFRKTQTLQKEINSRNYLIFKSY